jgi:hypothetical protein
VRSPIPWRDGDEAERNWNAEHGITSGHSTEMGPRWAAELSRLAVLLHARLGAWPAHAPCPDDDTQMVWELFERLVRICDTEEAIGMAVMSERAGGQPGVGESRVAALHQLGDHQAHVFKILGDVLRFTPAGFGRFKAALRNVVESMLTEPHAAGATPGNPPADPTPPALAEAPADESVAWVPRCGGALFCSPDYGSVRRGTETFTFSPSQRACLRYLVEAWERGRREFTNRELLDAAGSTANYIRDVFRSNGKAVPAWNNMITEVEGKKGSYTLRLTPED